MRIGNNLLNYEVSDSQSLSKGQTGKVTFDKLKAWTSNATSEITDEKPMTRSAGARSFSDANLNFNP